MSDIPAALQYKQTKPQGFPNAVKEVSFTPVNTQNSWVPGEPIRWEIKSNGFLDPYTTRLNFDVVCDDLSVDEIRRLDGSAHSFFSELTIWVRGIQIESIREYDVLSSILHDINWNANDRVVKAHEGHGISDLSQGEFSHKQMDAFGFFAGKVDAGQSSSCYDPTDARHPNGVAPELGIQNENTRTDVTETQFAQLASDIATGTTPSTGPWNQAPVLLAGTNLRDLLGHGGNLVGMQTSGTAATAAMKQVTFVADTTGNQSIYVPLPKTFTKHQDEFCYSGTYMTNEITPGYRRTGTNQYYGWISENGYNVLGLKYADSQVEKWPNVFTNASQTVSRRLAALYCYGSAGEFFKKRNSVLLYANTGYYKTSPWTYNRSDYHESFEVAPDYTSTEGYYNRITKKQLVEGGRGVTTLEMANEGYKQPYNPLFCGGLDEVYFAGSNIEVSRIIKGKPAKQMGRKHLSMTVPLLSAIFGVLLPPELFKLIPLNIMEDLVIELKLSNYALFSSGYKSTYTSGGIFQNEVLDTRDNPQFYHQKEQNTRSYRIIKMEMLADVLSFTPQIEQLVAGQYQSEGIVIQTQGFALGPQTQFATSAQVAGTHQLNYSFNSLKAMFWRYLPLDHEKYSFCRKQFALSHNVTNMKLQLGQDFLPIDGIRGNAGTPFGLQEERYGSNKEFYNQMLKAFDKLHNMSGNMQINPFNYSVNDRCYDPTFKGSYYRVQTFGGVTMDVRNLGYVERIYDETTNLSFLSSHNVIPYNTHTALQLPGFHETRLKGRCLFALDCESLRTDWGFISGLNTYDFKPFNLVMEVDNDTTKHFKRDSKIWLYFHYDTAIHFRAGTSPVVFGKS